MRKVAFILLLSIFGTGLVLADGKITVDPNLPGASSIQKKNTEADARLDQKVTYEAKQKTVSEILEDLTKQTGVILKAGQNSKDWESRDVKMCIFAKDLPLRKLMNSMARVMNFRWTREGKEGEYVYRFYMSERTKREAEERRIREEEEKQKWLTEKRRRALESYLAAASMSPAELEKLKTENPFLYALAKAETLQPLTGLLSETPSAMDAIMTGQYLAVPATTLTPEGQNLLIKSIQNFRRFANKLGGTERPLPDDIASKIDQAKININMNLEELGNIPGIGFLLGMIIISVGDETEIIPMIDPNSSIAKSTGNALIKTEEGIPIEEALKPLESEIDKLIQREEFQTGEPEPKHPDEPALHEKYKLKLDNKLVEVMAELSKVTGFSIVSDSYFVTLATVRLMRNKHEDEERELKDILDTLAECYGYNWEKHGEVLEFRDKKWYQKRAALIPQDWIKAWREKLKKTGTLEIDDLTQIASLSPEQLRENIASEEVFARANLMSIYFVHRDTLRLYGALDENQRAALFSGGLDMHLLTPDQLKLAEKLLNHRKVTYFSHLSTPDTPIIMSATQKKLDKQYSYSFTITIEAQDPMMKPIKWDILTPLYVEPSPQPQTEDKSEGTSDQQAVLQPGNKGPQAEK
ncbi:MAG: hypothetical protein ACUVRS_07515 [Armatimonadota bacterium]